MTKTSAENIRNALSKIGIDETLNKESSLFEYPVNNYQISLSSIQNVIDQYPDFNNFKVLEVVLENIIALNQGNHIALFACYRLLSKYAKDYGDMVHKEYSRMAMLNHLNWKLTEDYPYALIITKCSCTTCIQLTDYCNTAKKVKEAFVDAIGHCPIGMTSNTVVGLSEIEYYRRQKDC